MTDKKYYAFLVTYNRSQTLADVIENIIGQTISPHLLIIINNNSIDETKEVLHEYKNPKIIVLHSKENLGHGAALALGFKYYLENYYSREDILMLFEDDSKPDKNLFVYMSKPYLEKNLDFLSLDGFLIKMGRRKKPVTSPHELAEVDFGLLDGCLINSEVIKVAGLPVEDWFMMYDDLEFCKRIKQHGYKIFITENKFHKIHHLGAGSRWRFYYQSRNHVHYLKKYFSPGELCDFVIIEGKRLYGHVRKLDWKSFHYRILGLMAGLRGVKGKSLDPPIYGKKRQYGPGKLRKA